MKLSVSTELYPKRTPDDTKGPDLSHAELKYTSHKIFPPRSKFKSSSTNPRLWGFKGKEDYRHHPRIHNPAACNDTSPGPGSYFLESKFRQTLGVILKEPSHKFLSTVDNVGPGPGFYNITTVWRGRQTKPVFTSSKLKQLYEEINEPTPGPGSYRQEIGKVPVMSKYRSSSTHVIPKAARIKELKDSTPGPGAYLSQRNPIIQRNPSIQRNRQKFLHRYMF